MNSSFEWWFVSPSTVLLTCPSPYILLFVYSRFTWLVHLLYEIDLTSQILYKNLIFLLNLGLTSIKIYRTTFNNLLINRYYISYYELSPSLCSILTKVLGYVFHHLYSYFFFYPYHLYFSLLNQFTLSLQPQIQWS